MTQNNQSLAAIEQATAIVRHGGADDYRPLSVYAAGRTDEPIRIEVLATLSAGYRQDPRPGASVGLPARSVDGTIYVHGDLDRVPNLLATLEQREGKGFTGTFPSNDLHDVIQSGFFRYSQTRMEAFGDEHSVTTIELRESAKRDRDGKPVMEPIRRTVHKAENPADYERIIRTCKVYHRVLFYLMIWGPDGLPQIDLSDGLAPYAIRTTSHHSINSILSAIRETQRYTSGRIAGVPFEFWLDPKREVAGPDGSKRRIPVWRAATRTPRGIRLTPDIWRRVAIEGMEQREQLSLALPSGRPEDLADEAADELGVMLPDEGGLAYLADGGHCDAARWEAIWFARVRDTALDGADARRAFLLTYTSGRTDSLAGFLGAATEAEASALVAAAGEHLGRDQRQQSAARYQAIYANQFGDEDAAPAVIQRPSGAVRVDTGEVIDGTAIEVPDAAPAWDDGADAWEAAAAEDEARHVQAIPDPVTSVRDADYQRYATLHLEAARLGIAHEEARLPIDRDLLAEMTRELDLKVGAADGGRLL